MSAFDDLQTIAKEIENATFRNLTGPLVTIQLRGSGVVFSCTALHKGKRLHAQAMFTYDGVADGGVVAMRHAVSQVTNAVLEELKAAS